MERSADAFDTGVIKQLSTIEEKHSSGTSMCAVPISGNLEDFKNALNSRDTLLRQFELGESSASVQVGLEKFCEDLIEIRQALEVISTQIDVKQSQHTAFGFRIDRLIHEVVRNEEKIEEVQQGLLGVELRAKDFAVAAEYFDGGFRECDKGRERNKELWDKAGVIEERVEGIKKEKVKSPRWSKDEERLILSVKCRSRVKGASRYC